MGVFKNLLLERDEELNQTSDEASVDDDDEFLDDWEAWKIEEMLSEAED